MFLNGDFYPYPTYFENITGTNNYFNFLDPVYPPNPYPTFLNLTSTREAIHVGNQAYWDYNATVEMNLIQDWMKSVEPEVATLLDNYKVVISLPLCFVLFIFALFQYFPIVLPSF
jgi:vitellogenic carboxypeptidase-like protein